MPKPVISMRSGSTTRTQFGAARTSSAASKPAKSASKCCTLPWKPYSTCQPTGSAGRKMEKVELALDAEEHGRIGRMSCAEAALELCRVHLRRAHPGVTFVAPSKGADLRVRVPGGTEFDLE